MRKITIQSVDTDLLREQIRLTEESISNAEEHDKGVLRGLVNLLDLILDEADGYPANTHPLQ